MLPFSENLNYVRKYNNTNQMVSGILWVRLLEGTAGTSVEGGHSVQAECDVVENLHAAHLLPVMNKYKLVWSFTPFNLYE